MAGPESGPCSPWVDAAQIRALPNVTAAAAKVLQAGQLTDGQVQSVLALSAAAASHVLYELSARVYTGECGPVTVRPVSRPTDVDTRSSVGALGWFSSWGMGGSMYGNNQTGVAVHYGGVEPPTIRLPWPVSQVTLVKIDGVVIPADEYELRSFQQLVRMRTSASADPTQRWGWPTSQILDLEDDQPGTFSITFTFGTPPPPSGELAALKLGEYLALPQLGDSTHYPNRTTQIARQGVTAQVASTIDVLAKGSLGIWEVDAFLLAVNPKRLQRQATVWSPDVARPRRQAVSTLSPPPSSLTPPIIN